MNFKKILFLFVVLLFFTKIYSQVEYKMYSGAYAEYLTGEDIVYNYLGVDYTLTINKLGYGIFFGYNINKNLATELNFLNNASMESTPIKNEYKALKLAFNYSFLPYKSISPFISTSISGNSIKIIMHKYILMENGTTQATIFSYEHTYYRLGYTIGGGIRFKPGLKFEIVPYYYHNFCINTFNNNAFGVSFKYNFITKKH